MENVKQLKIKEEIRIKLNIALSENISDAITILETVEMDQHQYNHLLMIKGNFLLATRQYSAGAINFEKYAEVQAQIRQGIMVWVQNENKNPNFEFKNSSEQYQIILPASATSGE